MSQRRGEEAARQHRPCCEVTGFRRCYQNLLSQLTGFLVGSHVGMVTMVACIGRFSLGAFGDTVIGMSCDGQRPHYTGVGPSSRMRGPEICECFVFSVCRALFLRRRRAGRPQRGRAGLGCSENAVRRCGILEDEQCRPRKLPAGGVRRRGSTHDRMSRSYAQAVDDDGLVIETS